MQFPSARTFGGPSAALSIPRRLWPVLLALAGSTAATAGGALAAASPSLAMVGAAGVVGMATLAFASSARALLGVLTIRSLTDSFATVPIVAGLNAGAVVGLEAELTDSTAKTGYTNGDFEGFGFGNVKAGRDLFLGARVGAKVAPDLLLYAKGGYTNAKLNILSNDGTTEYNEDFDLDGWRAGAGVEYAINSNTFMNVEYRYSNYSKGEVDFDGSLPDSDRFDVDLDRHQIMAGVGVRF